MDLWQLLRLSIRALAANKFRAALTMLGLVIGVSAVIAVMAVGSGGRQMISAEILKYGTLDGLSVRPDWRKDHEEGIRTRLTLDDVDAVREAFPRLRNVTPQYWLNTGTLKIRYRDTESQGADVGAVEGEANRILENIQMQSGRFLSRDDHQQRAMVCVIDETLRDELFAKGTNPLGQEITFGPNYLTVVGVAKTQKGLVAMMGNEQGRLFMPLGVGMMIDGESQFVDGLSVQVPDLATKDDTAKKLIDFLKMRHNGIGNYRTQSMESVVSMFNTITGVLSAIISSVAAISLLVGGIGIMNIMLVSVTERTKEIGLRKAIGARRRDILGQFLCEAVVLSFCGGILGILAGLGLSGAGTLVINKLQPDLAFRLPVEWAGLTMATAISVAIGVFFGFYPAYRASKLSPIEALRTE
jgi:putative ABC transport system permease protein